jgi:hypothetical protein
MVVDAEAVATVMAVGASFLVLACLVWTARKLHWRGTPWVAVGLVMLIMPDGWAQAVLAPAPPDFTVWGYTAVELLALLSRWKMAMDVMVIAMVTILLFGDVVRLSWQAQLGIDSRFGDVVESWTRRPRMMGMMMMMMGMMPPMFVFMFRMQLP